MHSSRPSRPSRPSRFSRLSRLTLAILGLVALCPSAAWAHEFPGAGDFYGGMLHALTSLDMLLAMVALGILAGQQGREQALGALGAFPVAVLIGAAVGAAGLGPRDVTFPLVIAMVATGLLVAAGRALPSGLVPLLAVALGLMVGAGNAAEMTADTVALRFVPGVALAGLLVVAWLVGFVRWLSAPWTRIAVRVGGSWIAATGIMVLALKR
jgi:urease accessory protein